MSNNKQSSVEWLCEELLAQFYLQIDSLMSEEIKGKIEQAKAMHKEETINFALCYTFGQYNVPEKIRMNIEKYYNETFGGNND